MSTVVIGLQTHLSQLRQELQPEHLPELQPEYQQKLQPEYQAELQLLSQIVLGAGAKPYINHAAQDPVL